MSTLKSYQFLFILLPLVALLSLGILLDKKQQNSRFENRKLATAPAFWWKNRNLWENYLSDRLPTRNLFLNIYFNLMGNSDAIKRGMFVGKDNWIVMLKDVKRNLSSMAYYQNKPLISTDEEQQILESLQRINTWCKENNIQFYFMVPPDKSRVYERFVPRYILQREKTNEVDVLLNKIPREINFVPVLDLLRQASYREEPLYYREDSHWNETGAWLVYKQLMAAMQKDFPDIQPLDETTDLEKIKRQEIFSPYNKATQPIFSNGNLTFPGIKKTTQPGYTHYVFKKRKDIVLDWQGQFRSSSYSQAKNGYHIYIIGDSYATYLHSFLAATFTQVNGYRFNDPGKDPDWGIYFFYRQEEMKQNKTNILILSVSDLKILDLAEAFK